MFILAGKREAPVSFRLIKNIDTEAFVSQSAVIGVYGGGICRAFVPDTGCGVTQWFAFGGEMAASMSCYYGQTASTIEIEAETDCEMFIVDKPTLENLCSTQIILRNNL